MPAAKTTTKPRKAAATKAAAATADKKKNTPRTFDFRGLTITLPKTLPLSTAFAYRRMQRDSQGDALAFLDLLEKIVGPEQYEAIERKLDDDGLTMDNDVDVLPGLIEGVMEAFGTTTGE